MTVEDPVTSQMESAVYGLRKVYIEERVQIKHLCFHVLCACRGAKGRNPAICLRWCKVGWKGKDEKRTKKTSWRR